MESDNYVDEMLIRKQSAEHLLNVGKFLQSSCPPASRFYMFSLEKKLIDFPDLLKNYKSNKMMYCHHCGSVWNAENCSIKLQPRPHRNRHITMLQKMQAKEPWKLNSRQKQKLRKFYQSTNKIVCRCHSCKKKTVFPGTKTCDKQKNSKVSTSTPLQKIKLKRGDLNSGLFIPSPSPSSLSCSEKDKLKESGISEQSSLSETVLNVESTRQQENESFEPSVNPPELNTAAKNKKLPYKNQTPPNLKFPSQESPSSQKQSTGKKKKTLLAQILEQEKNRKKKTSLSSFLVSL